jgi:hypothetical protein
LIEPCNSPQRASHSQVIECSFVAVKQRERHDNASLTPEAIAHVRKKFTKEEKLSYHILSLDSSGLSSRDSSSP